VQSQKVASQRSSIEDLRAQITKWQNAARGVNKESKGRQKEVARLEAELAAAKRSREELLYALEQAHERNAFLESSLTSSQRSLNDQVGVWLCCRGHVSGASSGKHLEHTPFDSVQERTPHDSMMSKNVPFTLS
jgi:predicted  nucleic acid-binding Zn-ribbon protein